MRLACRELLFELSHKVELRSKVEGLRLATMEDLHLIATVHAAMSEAESGINPLEADREGFLSRCGRRITKDRVLVLVAGEILDRHLSIAVFCQHAVGRIENSVAGIFGWYSVAHDLTNDYKRIAVIIDSDAWIVKFQEKLNIIAGRPCPTSSRCR